jgi:hypothetical protein
LKVVVSNRTVSSRVPVPFKLEPVTPDRRAE